MLLICRWCSLDTQPRREFAIYREKFINSEAAQRLRKRLEERGDTHITPQDYEELLQAVVNQSPSRRTSIFDKKYFDYLPAENLAEDMGLGEEKNINLQPVEIEFEQLYSSAEEPQKTLVYPIDHLDDQDIEVGNLRAKRDLHSNSEFISNQWRQNGKHRFFFWFHFIFATIIYHGSLSLTVTALSLNCF